MLQLLLCSVAPGTASSAQLKRSLPALLARGTCLEEGLRKKSGQVCHCPPLQTLPLVHRRRRGLLVSQLTSPLRWGSVQSGHSLRTQALSHRTENFPSLSRFILFILCFGVVRSNFLGQRLPLTQSKNIPAPAPSPMQSLSSPQSLLQAVPHSHPAVLSQLTCSLAKSSALLLALS